MRLAAAIRRVRESNSDDVPCRVWYLLSTLAEESSSSGTHEIMGNANGKLHKYPGFEMFTGDAANRNVNIERDCDIERMRISFSPGRSSRGDDICSILGY
jgi:hypothetical protein